MKEPKLSDDIKPENKTELIDQIIDRINFTYNALDTNYKMEDDFNVIPCGGNATDKPSVYIFGGPVEKVSKMKINNKTEAKKPHKNKNTTKAVGHKNNNKKQNREE